MFKMMDVYKIDAGDRKRTPRTKLESRNEESLERNEAGIFHKVINVWSDLLEIVGQ